METLPFELRLEIFRIARRNAFSEKIKRFERVHRYPKVILGPFGYLIVFDSQDKSTLFFRTARNRNMTFIYTYDLKSTSTKISCNEIMRPDKTWCRNLMIRKKIMMEVTYLEGRQVFADLMYSIRDVMTIE